MAMYAAKLRYINFEEHRENAKCEMTMGMLRVSDTHAKSD